MIAVWPSGVAWSTHFVEKNGDELVNNTVSMIKGGSATVKLIVFCDGVCEAYDTNTVQIYASSDPVWYNRNNTSDENNTSNENNTCGSDDCETDTTPASHSTNVTNTVSIVLTARTAYDFSMACDGTSSEGNNEVTGGHTTLWGYMVENNGWMMDWYRLDMHVTSEDEHDVSYWNIKPGIADGRELTGQSDSSETAVHTIEASMSMTPPTNATPGIYNVELIVSSGHGAPPDACDFDVVIPGAETEDDANKTAEKEPEEFEEVPREVPAISLVPVLVSIGLVAVSRRK